MHIKYVEVSNFRKLLAVRIDFAEQTTLLVGANNSGKTSAMLALRRFLVPRARNFDTHDITLCHWASINALGESWIAAEDAGEIAELSLDQWTAHLPALDLWMQVGPAELHHVSSLIPTLDWEGGLLGVRLRLEPKDPETLFKQFLSAMADAAVMTAAAQPPDGEEEAAPKKLTVWPINLMDFLSKKLGDQFVVRAYVLDPAKIAPPSKSQANPQALSSDASPIDGDPLAGLIRVNEINAQRGFGEAQSDADDGVPGAQEANRLSDQLRAYWKRHLDPSDSPDPNDLEALLAIEAAQDAFDSRLKSSFVAAFSEVEDLGYPGVTDPKPHIATRLRAIDGLNHDSAVTFEVDLIDPAGGVTPVMRLPEGNNGLGYQNLISMIFRLMAYRDAWMRVGKAGKGATSRREPLHLVLVEEPEAHLHAQVQQVFIKKAYNVLRKHADLGSNTQLSSQLVVSTHSSHVAHEMPFACLRYFRRLPAGMVTTVPVSTVVNLSEVFGPGNQTERFVTRYLRAQHADLFFADAAILVEGAAERMMLPNFIQLRHSFLHQCYLTLLEIGGSHAHTLRPLIDHLGLITLVVTDLDAGAEGTGNAVQPKLGANQTTNNKTLREWLPKLHTVDDLASADTQAKVYKGDDLFEVRIAYQVPVSRSKPGSEDMQTVVPYTFEDALAFDNLPFFASLEGSGLIRKFREAINAGADIEAIGAAFFTALRSGTKAEFALNVLGAEGFETLQVPSYIAEGLTWLEERLKKKQVEILPKAEEAVG